MFRLDEIDERLRDGEGSETGIVSDGRQPLAISFDYE